MTTIRAHVPEMIVSNATGLVIEFEGSVQYTDEGFLFFDVDYQGILKNSRSFNIITGRTRSNDLHLLAKFDFTNEAINYVEQLYVGKPDRLLQDYAFRSNQLYKQVYMSTAVVVGQRSWNNGYISLLRAAHDCKQSLGANIVRRANITVQMSHS